MVNLLTVQQCAIKQYSLFEFKGGEYYATAVLGTMVTAESTDGKRQINVHSSLFALLDN